MSGDRTFGDKMSVGKNVRGDNTSVGLFFFVRRDKTSGQTKRPATKRPEGQNVRRDKTSSDNDRRDKTTGGTKRLAGKKIPPSELTKSDQWEN